MTNGNFFRMTHKVDGKCILCFHFRRLPSFTLWHPHPSQDGRPRLATSGIDDDPDLLPMGYWESYFSSHQRYFLEKILKPVNHPDVDA